MIKSLSGFISLFMITVFEIILHLFDMLHLRVSAIRVGKATAVCIPPFVDWRNKITYLSKKDNQI